MLGQDRAVAGGEFPLVLGTEAASNDPHAIAIQIERARQADRIGRHRVRVAIVHHDAHRTDAHREAQRQIRRRDLQRSQAGPLFSNPLRRRDAGGPRRTHRIGLGEPLAQLLLQIRAIEKAPLFEEGALHPSDQILDTPFLLRPVRPAHFHPEPEIERHAGKGRIPFGHHAIAAPLQRHRFRSIKHRDQGDAAKCLDVIDERAHQTFDLLIGHQRHRGPARVLQARGEEVHDLLRPVLIAHAHFAEIVLRKFSGKPFDPDQRRHDVDPQGLRASA